MSTPAISIVPSAIETVLTVPASQHSPASPGQTQPRLHPEPLLDAPLLDPGGCSNGGTGTPQVSPRAGTVGNTGGSSGSQSAAQPGWTQVSAQGLADSSAVARHSPSSSSSSSSDTKLDLRLEVGWLELTELSEPLVERHLAAPFQHYFVDVHPGTWSGAILYV